MGAREAEKWIALAQKAIPKILELACDAWINLKQVGELIHEEGQTFLFCQICDLLKTLLPCCIGECIGSGGKQQVFFTKSLQNF